MLALATQLNRIIFQLKALTGKKGYYGHYKNWQLAEKHCRGYENPIILQKVLEATLAVQRGDYAFERDGFLFKKADYDFHLISALFFVSAQKNNCLNVLDFGGSLGSHFFQHKKFISLLDSISWMVVEQKHFVDAGKQHIKEDDLHFFENYSQAIHFRRPDILLLGCVLPYLEKPYEWLERFAALNIPYLLIDKHPIIHSENDRLCIQKYRLYGESISYPAWFFSENKFLQQLNQYYEVVYDYLCPDLCNIKAEFKGYFLKKKDVKTIS
jgi:putative methyltransferase (TIGR04325 family)